MNDDMNKGMKRVIFARSIAVGLIVGGAILIGITTSWWASLGIFLMIVGNNIERSKNFKL